jgi:Holliday junction resolvasome RuvABC ATP-dependent DNA helicase subunit
MNENLNPEKTDFDPEEIVIEQQLRPLTFKDFTGQEKVLDNLQVFVLQPISEEKHWITLCFTVHPDWERLHWLIYWPMNWA